jgi:chemotaxis family two-component system sensor kinase Cph1
LAAGLLSTGLNSIAAAYFLLPPFHSFRIAEPDDALHLATLAFVGVLISWLCESRRQTAIQLRSAVLNAQRLRFDARDSVRRLAEAEDDLKFALSALLENVNRSAGELQRFAQGLANYASLTHQARRIESIDAARLVADAIQAIGSALPETAHITSDVPPLTIEGDAHQLSELLQHLIDNAIKFRSDDQMRIRISAKERSERLTFSVADNGIGLIPAHWEQAFALGRRLHGDEYPGAGMGLALARRIVENHRGRIWLISESGEGTTVRFTIPRKAG